MPMGITDGSNAAAGQVGEYLSSVVSTAVTLTAGGYTVVGTLSLTAGDWDVWGEADFNLTTSSTQQIAAMIATTTGQPNLGDAASRYQNVVNSAGGANFFVPMSLARINVSATTTLYLNMFIQNGMSGGGTGKLCARRRR